MTVARSGSLGSLTYDQNSLFVYCSGRKITIEFPVTLSFDDLQSATNVHVAVSGATDIAGNAMQGMVTWSFEVSGVEGERGGEGA